MRAGDHDAQDLALAQTLFTLVGEPSENDEEDVRDVVNAIRSVRDRLQASNERFTKVFNDLSTSGMTDDQELVEAIVEEFDRVDSERRTSLGPVVDDLRDQWARGRVRNLDTQWDKIVAHAVRGPARTPDGQRVDHLLEVAPRPRVVEVPPGQALRAAASPELVAVVDQVPAGARQPAARYETLPPPGAHLQLVRGGQPAKPRRPPPAEVFLGEFRRRSLRFGKRPLRVRDLFLPGTAQDAYSVIGLATMGQDHHEPIGEMNVVKKTDGSVKVTIVIHLKSEG